MNTIKINETPVRTSRNFKINNVKIDGSEIPGNIGKFENLKIVGQDSKVKIESNINDLNLRYGLGEVLENQTKNQANKKIKMTIDSKTEKEMQINFKFDRQNKNLVEDIQIVANPQTKETVVIKYYSQDEEKYFHNGVIRVLAKENSTINVIIINFINTNSNNFLSIENELEENAKIKYTIIDFGGKNSVTNYYSNLIGKQSENLLNTIYLGKGEQLFDLNYIGEIRGEKSNINIEVQGALKDKARKRFKGTIDFKKGCKKATGNENEECTLLSKDAKSLALPMLLCSEEDVEGNHSTSSGKVGEKELFYIMSRGFEEKEAMKLMVKAKFNKIISNIKNQEIKEEILKKIDEKIK